MHHFKFSFWKLTINLGWYGGRRIRWKIKMCTTTRSKASCRILTPQWPPKKIKSLSIQNAIWIKIFLFDRKLIGVVYFIIVELQDQLIHKFKSIFNYFHFVKNATKKKKKTNSLLKTSVQASNFRINPTTAALAGVLISSQ